MRINDFAKRFNANIDLEEEQIIRKKGRCFLLNQTIKPLLSNDFFYAGTYLGKLKGETFFPSIPLLTMIAKRKANKIVVDTKTEWLFTCGRDIFKQGITSIIGSKRKGDHTLIMNQHNECLGFGKIVRDIDKEKNRGGVVVKNILDIGDFLRREE